MTAPRVLLVVPQLPSPVRDGADLRLLGIAAALARSSTVSVAALSGATSPPPAFVDGWESGSFASPDGPPLLRHLLEHPDDPFGPFAAPEVVEFVRGVVHEVRPDLVVFARLQTWRLAAAVLDGVDIPAVLDLDASNVRVGPAISSVAGTDPAARVYARFNAAAARYEQTALPVAAAIWVCSDIEAAAVRDATGLEATVIPNTVDVDAYAAPGTVRLPGRLVFPATFRYLPNEAAAREIVDDLAPRLPDHEFWLVGSHAPAWLREGTWPGVRVVGQVPSMAEYLASATAVVVPLRAGTGTRLKILEAMAAGTPVVSTAIGAEGLGLEAGRHYLGAETADEFAYAVRLLGDDPVLSERIARAGREFVVEQYSLDALAPLVAAQLDHLLAGASAG